MSSNANGDSSLGYYGYYRERPWVDPYAQTPQPVGGSSNDDVRRCQYPGCNNYVFSAVGMTCAFHPQAITQLQRVPDYVPDAPVPAVDSTTARLWQAVGYAMERFDSLGYPGITVKLQRMLRDQSKEEISE